MSEKTELVRSHGIFHALPTYPDSPEHQRLTAIVTGANGISGYHMVKVLAAAPERWSKIYCLSRRPPPDYFFEDLGEGASRVEHVEVDFLDTSGGIGKALKSKVDTVYATISWGGPHTDRTVTTSSSSPSQRPSKRVQCWACGRMPTPSRSSTVRLKSLQAFQVIG